MTQKSGKAPALVKGTENEVEKGRDMGEWRRVLDLLEVGRGKQGPAPGDLLVNFLYHEAKLEAWLEDHQPPDKFIAKAQATLIDIKKGLLLCLSHAGDQVTAFRFSVIIDST